MNVLYDMSQISLQYIIEGKCNGLPTSQAVDFTNGMNVICRAICSMVEQSYLYNHTQKKNMIKSINKRNSIKIVVAGDGRYDSARFS